MKNMKKLGSILLALVMMISMVTSAMATTVTIDEAGNNETLKGHTFEAYQIFSGEKSGNDGNTLSNVQWGSGINQANFLAALQGSDKFSGTATVDGEEVQVNNVFDYCDVKDPTGVAEAMAQFSNNSAAAKEIANLAYQNKSDISTSLEAGETEELDDGYYVIVDTTPTEGQDAVKNAALLQIAGNDVTIAVKTDTTQFDKKVMDTNDSTGETTGWQDSADYDINDNIPYRLTIQLPNNVDSYTEGYYVKITDTLSEGLTNNKDAKIYISDAPLTATQASFDGKEFTVDTSVATDVTSSFTFITNDDQSLVIEKNNIQGLVTSMNDKVITVLYSAKLNEKAKIGSEGNPNTAYLEYSNNPNDEGKGKTTEDKVTVFTFKTVIDKVDQNGDPLEGAEFTLEKKIFDESAEGGYRWDAIQVVKNPEGTEFTFKGLDDGEYRLHESVTPAGYNTIEDIYFKVTATHETDSTNPQLTGLNGERISGVIAFNRNPSDEDALTADVVNRSGSILPETGGIGTTIFYVVGGILVAGAAILLITQKRMNRKH